MPALAIDPCTTPLGSLCDVAARVSGSVNAAASDYLLGGLGRAFVDGAQAIATMALASLDGTTAIDLSASWFRSNLAVIAAITLPVVVGLFVLQVLSSVLRHEPGGLVRAVTGVGKALIGSALALAVTQVALTAVDGICEFIASSAGLSVSSAAAKFFDFTQLITGSSPVLQIAPASTRRPRSLTKSRSSVGQESARHEGLRARACQGCRAARYSRRSGSTGCGGALTRIREGFAAQRLTPGGRCSSPVTVNC